MENGFTKALLRRYKIVSFFCVIRNFFTYMPLEYSGKETSEFRGNGN